MFSFPLLVAHKPAGPELAFRMFNVKRMSTRKQKLSPRITASAEYMDTLLPVQITFFLLTS
jgi:hypothetical protein